jgi:uncharacterized protein (DUF1330 family)
MPVWSGVDNVPPSVLMADTAVTLCVFLWPNEGEHERLIAYEDAVLSLIPAHGGRVLHRVRTAGADDEPLEIHLLEFRSEAALDAYMQDDRRAGLAEDRTRAIARTEVFRVTSV